MRSTALVRAALFLLTGAAGLSLGLSCNDPLPPNARPGQGSQLFTSPQANPVALSCDGELVYVANTTSGTLSIIETAGTNRFVAEIAVGLDPVGVAVRPKLDCDDALEDEQVFVTNHVSDSIAVVSRSTATVLQVIQELDGDGVTRTDEPVGVVFASRDEAYVTLDDANEVVKLTPDAGGNWAIAERSTDAGNQVFTAQAPRALAAGGGRIVVASFESGNQSEFPSCGAFDPPIFVPGDPNDEGCQFPLHIGTLLMFASSPNIGGEVIHDGDLPDRDVFVYDSTLGAVGSPVEGVGTLLYGVASVGSRVWVTNTDARNKLDGLTALGNRMFDNRLAIIDCDGSGCSLTANVDLDARAGVPVPTPYGIAADENGQVLVVSVAGSDGQPGIPSDAGTDIPGLITLDSDGNVLGAVQTGAIPQGVALASDANGDAATAYVLNTVDSTMSVVDVSTPAAPTVVNTISVGSDPTSAEVRAGRIAFSAARASTSGTFSCESCHPNGNIDQILWTINTDLAPGDPCGGADVCPEPRSTMPIRGLRDTLPLHWAGNLADPFSGLGVGGPEDPVAPDCDISVVGENGCIRHLVDASLSGVMCDPGSCPVGPAGLPGALTDQERNDMAAFMGAVSFPPSPTRRPTDVLSASALQGADDFFTDQGGNLLATCADSTSGCHSLPLTVSTNSATVGGFDAPSIRGLWDRSITFSNGLTSSEEQLTAQGFDPKPGGMSEFGSLAATFPTLFTVGYNVPVDDIWSFINEMSVGLPGLTGRQIVLTAANANDPSVAARLAQMEAAADEGRVSAVARVVKSTYVFDAGAWVPRRGASPHDGRAAGGPRADRVAAGRHGAPARDARRRRRGAAAPAGAGPAGRHLGRTRTCPS